MNQQMWKKLCVRMTVFLLEVILNSTLKLLRITGGISNFLLFSKNLFDRYRALHETFEETVSNTLAHKRRKKDAKFCTGGSLWWH